MPVPNLYNPYAGLDLAQSAGNELGQLGQKAVQERLQFQEQQRQEAQPSGITLEDWQKIHEALANGADPAELAMRHKMHKAGILQHPAQGLPDDHPITQSHPYAPQTSLGPQQQAPQNPMGQLASQGPEQPSQPSPQPEQAQQNPQAQGQPTTLTYGQLKQLPHMLAETPAERAGREQEKARIAGQYGLEKQKEITTRLEYLQSENAELRKQLEEMKQTGATKRTGITAGAGIKRAQIGAEARVEAASILADARKASARAASSADPKLKQMGAELNKLIGEEASMAQPGANDTNSQERRRRMDQLRKEIDQRVGLPAAGPAPAAQFGNPGATGSNAWDSVFGNQ